MSAAQPQRTLVLAVEGLHVHYGPIEALHDITIDVLEGELVALVGGNGAGKSTLLRTLSGIHTVSKGSVRYLGKEVTRTSPSTRVKQGFCHVPEGRQVFGPMTVENNLRLGAYVQGGGTAADLDRMYGLFPILAQKRTVPAGLLSGGQQQMLAIARALMGRPKVLLLDEPSMGLAPRLVKEVFGTIGKLKAQGITIVLVEQNAAAALAIADRAYVMESGHIVLSGSGASMLENSLVKAAYLGI